MPKQEFEYERCCYYCGAPSVDFVLQRVTMNSGRVFTMPIYHCEKHKEVANAR